MEYHKYHKIKEIVHPSQMSSKLEQLFTYCDNEQVLFVDGEFPPDKTSLIGELTPADYNGQLDEIVYKRANDLFNGDYDLFRGISPGDIIQGSLGNCYFLCSLSSLAEYPDLIRRLFDFDERNPYGIQSVWLNINGAWKRIIMDEYFPAYFNGVNYDLAFSKTEQRELWVILLEKAYAKAYGSYWEIVGGDPVHALRDLTGAPYDRVEEWDDLDASWRKLAEANERRFMLTCFTKSTEIIEEQNAEGIVFGHAYTILDVRDIIDSRGIPARVIQIRNPWGKFEWNGDFSDNSPLWTDKQRSELDIRHRDDGIFWMKLEDFIQYFQGVGIVKIIPNFIGNSLKVDLDKNKYGMVRMVVENQTKLSISVDQIDSRLVDNVQYSYSYFRLTIGKLKGNEGIDFIDSILSPERNIFIENEFIPGEYIIMIEPYWSNDIIDTFNVSTYSDDEVELELLQVSDQMYENAEYLIWKDFGADHFGKMSFKGSRTVHDGYRTLDLDTYQYQNRRYASVLYNYMNKSSSSSLRQTYKILSNQGFQTISGQLNTDTLDVLMNPNGNDIILFKMDPRSQGFGLSHQVIQEEIINKKFTDNVQILEIINSMGGLQPTSEEPDPDLMSRSKKKQEQDEQKKVRKRLIEKLRAERQTLLKQQQERKRRLKEQRKRIEQERRKQMNSIISEYGDLYRRDHDYYLNDAEYYENQNQHYGYRPNQKDDGCQIF